MFNERYRLEADLGRGGMGVVCRAHIDWAEAHLARGDPGDHERAGELLREAESEFEAMGAPIIVEQIQERLAHLEASSRPT